VPIREKQKEYKAKKKKKKKRVKLRNNSIDYELCTLGSPIKFKHMIALTSGGARNFFQGEPN
jgi:hypothetical protein